MGLFDKLKKGTSPMTEQEAEETEPLEQETAEEAKAVEQEPVKPQPIKSVKIDLTDKAAVDNRLKEIYAMEELFVVLSLSLADMERGFSMPMVLAPDEEKKIILVFTQYEKAVSYVTKKRPMVVDNVFPIGKITKGDKIHTIDVICANAHACGINTIDFDIDDENGFGCKLDYFMAINNMAGQGQIVFSKEEMEQIKANDGKFNPRFNAMKILNFTNPYALFQKRADEVKAAVEGENGIQWARDNALVHELCYEANQLMKEAAKAEVNKDMEKLEQCKKLVSELDEVIFDKLAKLKHWYTLEKIDTGEIYTQNGAAYILYTPRYGSRMPQGTRLKLIPPTVAEFAYAIGNTPVNIVVVTDGPKIMHVIDRAVFGF